MLPGIRTDLIEGLLRNPAEVHVVVAGGSHFHFRSRTPPLRAHAHTHTQSDPGRRLLVT